MFLMYIEVNGDRPLCEFPLHLLCLCSENRQNSSHSWLAWFQAKDSFYNIKQSNIELVVTFTLLDTFST